MTLEEVKEMLADRNMMAVSRKTGVHHETLRRIQNGTAKNPSFDVMVAIISYLEKK